MERPPARASCLKDLELRSRQAELGCSLPHEESVGEQDLAQEVQVAAPRVVLEEACVVC